MKNLLCALAIVAALFSTAAQAQTSTGIVCGGFDTITNGTTPMAVLQSCTFTTGPYGIVYATATAETLCLTSETVRMYIGTGASPVNGSNFNGAVSSGVLTVISLIPGFGAAPWTIQTGQLLTPGSGATAFTATAITGQLSGTPGGVGTYSIANGALSIPSSTNLYTLNPIPGGATAITPAMFQTACVNGYIITSIAGAFVGLPRTQYWLDMAISTSSGADVVQWNNNGMAIFTY